MSRGKIKTESPIMGTGLDDHIKHTAIRKWITTTCPPSCHPERRRARESQSNFGGLPSKREGFPRCGVYEGLSARVSRPLRRFAPRFCSCVAKLRLRGSTHLTPPSLRVTQKNGSFFVKYNNHFALFRAFLHKANPNPQ